ncbi:MAG: energy-coupling factor transporter ATPase [Eubacteriales bacterium]
MSIIVNNLKYIYSEGMPYETLALDDVSFEINDNEFVGIIGHTGSGKSTLIQHLNGLLKPKSGEIIVSGFNITGKGIKMRDIRRKIGLVFQYPEYQLFEETVRQDVAFGPLNLGLSLEEANLRVREALALVGLDYEEVAERSPFDLSGGQKRRVAIAGVIAMKPEVLIMDEPTAGLDPKAHKEVLKMVKTIHDKEKNIVILVSHNMGDIAMLSDKIMVMDKGRISAIGTPREIFKEAALIEAAGLKLPEVTQFMRELNKRGVCVSSEALTIDEAEVEIIEYLRSKKQCLEI